MQRTVGRLQALRVLIFAFGAAAAAGCDALLPWLGGGDRDCLVTVQIPAPMFHVAAPATASAGVPFKITPWVLRTSGSYPRGDQVVPESFAATVDAAARTIKVSGSISRTNVRPGTNCAVPAMAVLPSAATLSLEVTAPAGTYTVSIPPENFTTEVPQLFGLPNEPPNGYPPAQASRSVTVQ